MKAIWEDPSNYEGENSFFGDGKYPPDWDARRNAVLRRYDYQCQNCGVKSGPHKGSEGVELHVHHRIPLADGGDNSLGNLTTLCKDCHERTHVKTEVKVAAKGVSGYWNGIVQVVREATTLILALIFILFQAHIAFTVWLIIGLVLLQVPYPLTWGPVLLQGIIGAAVGYIYPWRSSGIYASWLLLIYGTGNLPRLTTIPERLPEAPAENLILGGIIAALIILAPLFGSVLSIIVKGARLSIYLLKSV